VLYHAGGGRKIIFSFVFLLLLPFYVSLPAMLYMRIKAGLWADTLGLAILALGFTIIMALVLVELLSSLAMRVEIGDTGVNMILPNSRGPTPKLAYKRHSVPFDQIAAIETRREVYGGALTPVLMLGSRILTKDGKAIPLGYVNEANTDPAFPYIEIAQKIAERAGVPITDKGSVRRCIRRKMLGLRQSEENVEEVDAKLIEDLNKRHGKLVAGLVAVLVGLVITGMALDIIEDMPPTPAAKASATATPATKQPAKATPGPAAKQKAPTKEK
jgi:hypothetical protein